MLATDSGVGIGHVYDERLFAHDWPVQFATVKRCRRCLAFSASSIIATVVFKRYVGPAAVSLTAPLCGRAAFASGHCGWCFGIGPAEFRAADRDRVEFRAISGGLFIGARAEARNPIHHR